MNKMDPIIIVDKVSKRYRTGRKLTNLRELFSLLRDSSGNDYHWAVKDVNFELSPGESLGIIGPNGAGKTTILKILSNVTLPTSGQIRTNGRLSALIELGAGFHPDLTGRENIFLNGTILGMNTHEIKSRFDDIVAFASIGDYLDTPVKRYSSGMYARLGFAIAAHVDPQILLVDEVLAVGDYAFQLKCYSRMEALRNNGTALIFVSHNMEAVRRVCERGLVLYRGKSIFEGSAGEAVVAYSDAIRESARQAQIEIPIEEGLSQRVMTFDAEIEKVHLLDSSLQPVSMLESGESASIAIDILFHKDVYQPIFSCTFRAPDGRLIYDTTTRWMEITTPDFSAGDRCRVLWEVNLNLLDGEYQLGVDIASSNFSHYYDRMEHALSFWIKSSGESKGIVDLGAKFILETSTPSRENP